MKTAGVRDLKARLSQYLREVASGETVLVTDRGRVVAELRPPGSDASEKLTPDDQRWRDLLRSGFIRPAVTSDRSWLRRTGPALAPGTAQRLLDEDRGG